MYVWQAISTTSSVVVVDDAAVWAGAMHRHRSAGLPAIHCLKLNFYLAPFTPNECALGPDSFRQLRWMGP